MVAQHYRWDFVGLSTDTKPTPETSEKVVDGSTFYCSDTSKLYVFCKTRWYERKPLGGGGGGGTTYTAGDGIDITEDVISVDTETIQPKLTAGTNITISEDNVISATGGGGGGDTVYSDKNTSDHSTGGAVYIGNLNASQEEQPDPTTTDLHYKYFWALPYTNTSIPEAASINIMGSNCKSESVVIGTEANNPVGVDCVAIGNGANVRAQDSISIGHASYIGNNITNSVALGTRSNPTRVGEVNIGNTIGGGFNSTNYRVLGGVHDGQEAHDAVNVEQVNGLIDAINTALNTNIPHIGA